MTELKWDVETNSTQVKHDTEVCKKFLGKAEITTPATTESNTAEERRASHPAPARGSQHLGAKPNQAASPTARPGARRAVLGQH